MTDCSRKAFAEVELQIIADHQEEPLMGGFVETELLFQLLDKLRIEALRAAVFTCRVGGTGSRSLLAGIGHLRADIARNPTCRLDGFALNFRNQPLHRAARRDLHDGEIHHHDPEQSGDDEQ